MMLSYFCIKVNSVMQYLAKMNRSFVAVLCDIRQNEPIEFDRNELSAQPVGLTRRSAKQAVRPTDVFGAQKAPRVGGIKNVEL